MDNVKEDKDKETIKETIKEIKEVQDKKSQLWLQRRLIPLSNPIKSLKGTNGTEPLSPGYK